METEKRIHEAYSYSGPFFGRENNLTDSEKFCFFVGFFPKEMFDTWVLEKMFLKETGGKDLSQWALYDEKEPTSLALLLDHAHFRRYDLWKERRNFFNERFEIFPINVSILCYKPEHLKVLLKFGYNLELSLNLYEDLINTVVPLIVHPYQWPSCMRSIRLMGNRKRISLILLMIKIYRCADYISEGWDRALQELWKHNAISPLCKAEFLSVFESYPVRVDLERIYRRYMSTISQVPSSGVFQPFSLAHLSRCKVREIMGKYLALPRGVNELPIPPEMKQYLLFQ